MLHSPQLAAIHRAVLKVEWFGSLVGMLSNLRSSLKMAIIKIYLNYPKVSLLHSDNQSNGG